MNIPEIVKKQIKIFGSFGLIQAMQLILPLLALPWLARQLGPDAFGLLMYMLLIPPIVAQIMDWGLALNGAREISINRNNIYVYSQLIGAILSAKMLLASACLAGAVILYPFLPYANTYPLAYFLAIFAGIARGINPTWFFQGAGFGMPKMAIWDAGASLAILLCALSFIHQANTWIYYLFFLASIKFLVYGLLLYGICKQFGPAFSLKNGVGIMKSSYTLFGYSLSQIICYNGTQLIMGFFLNAEAMGILGATNKMLRAFASLILPFTQTLFPEICRLARYSVNLGALLARRSLVVTAFASIFAAIPVWLLTPWLIHIALGKDFQEAIPIFRIMLVASPFMVCNNVLAIQIMASNNMENLLFLLTALIAISGLLAAPIAALWGIDGAATLPILMESILTAIYLGAIYIHCPHILLSSKS